MHVSLLLETLLLLVGIDADLATWTTAQSPAAAIAHLSTPEPALTCTDADIDQRPGRLVTGHIAADGARRSTARAFTRAADDLGLRDRGAAWIGRLDSLGRGTRDAIVYVPERLDVTRPIELVVYMEGYRSFQRRAIRERHAAGIAGLLASNRNFVYIAPDVPSSAHGDAPEHKGPIWSSRCAEGKPCKGGALAPGDFVGFYREITDMLDGALCQRAAEHNTALGYRLSLIGFSAGGGGVFTAVRQLAQSTGPINLDTVDLRRVVFADAIYSSTWLHRTWERVRDLPGLEEFSILLMNGALTGPKAGRGAGGRNRVNAARFLAKYRPALDRTQNLLTPISGPISKPSAARPTRVIRDGQLGIAFLRASHRGIGDRAVAFAMSRDSSEPGPRLAAR